MKAPSPLLGFNNNVRHKGRVFHIQTEDSGIRHPHIITHLFADGGRILKTQKTTYAEHIGQPTLVETVRGMMQDQHKAMFIALRDGQFDHLFEDSSSGPQSTRGRAAAKPAATAREQAATVPAVEAMQPAASQPIAVAEAPSSRRGTSRPKLEIDPGLIHGHEPSSSPTVEVSPVSPSPPPAVVQPIAVQGPPRIRSEPSIDLDLDALERAAAEAQTPIFQQIQDLPPPPAAVLGKRTQAGGYSVRSVLGDVPRVDSPERGGIRRASPAAPVTSAAAQPARPVYAPPPQQPAGRYAPSRPAAIFATSRPSEGASIFGEDLISEKSLDEVILSYLAEDLENPPDKK